MYVVLNNYNSNWKKLLGFRNLQEKLENIPYILEGTIKEFWDTDATSFHWHRV